MLFRRSLCVNDSQWIWKFAWHSKVAHSKHLSLVFSVGHVLVGVDPCGRCTCNCGTVASYCKQSFPKIKLYWFQKLWSNLSRYIQACLQKCRIYKVGWERILNMLFRWSPCVNDSQSIWKFAWHSKATYSKHLPLVFSVGHVLVGVDPCGRCTINCGNVASNYKQSFP